MKQGSRERLATLLMDELVERLSGRESIRKMLGDMTSLPIDDVIEQLLLDFERAVEEYREKHVVSAKQSTEKRSKQTVEQKNLERLEPPPHPEVRSGPPHSVPSQLKSEPVVTEPAKAEPARLEPARPEPSRPESAKPESAKPESAKPEPVRPEPARPEPSRSEPARTAPSPRVVSKDPEREVRSAASVQLDPIKLEFPKIRLKVPDIPVTDKPPEHIQPKKEAPRTEAKKQLSEEEELRRLEELARKLEAEYTASARERKDIPEPFPHDEEPRVATAKMIVPGNMEAVGGAGVREDEEIDTAEALASAKQTTRGGYAFADDEYVYVHAVIKIADGESSSTEPFMLEEKGIDGRGFAFAIDYSGMRFYLSKINPNEMNVSKAMVLLLNKHESLLLQSVHESTLNDLRGHGVLLPFEFGTVARGKDSLHSIIDKNRDDLEEALEDVEKTTWWTVTASVLDATIGRLVGTEVQSVGRDRSRDRASYTSTPQGKKFDIKVLERILQREKKLAESVHAELSAVAERADVDTMVGLGSGSSEDWKVILKASYDVPKRDIDKFNRTVTDLQYHHLQYDLMLALTGKRDHFTLRRK